MKVLMFGWEFPPMNTGGLGTACYGLTKGLSQNGVSITLVLPQAAADTGRFGFLKIRNANISNVKVKPVKSAMVAYMSPSDYEQYMLKMKGRKSIYGQNLFEEVERFARQAAIIAKEELGEKGEGFDIIHAHDWMTYKAGMAAKRVSGKPLVVHVHATEFDRTGGLGANEYVYGIEKEGMEKADAVIAVSGYTRQKIMENYGIPESKIRVVHNAIDKDDIPWIGSLDHGKSSGSTKTVLYLGRITLQKGPDYFVAAAKKALEADPNIRFIIAGSGDMEPRIIEKAAELGIGHNVLFAGFLRDEEIHKAYRMADLYVMPSVSEPFGITPLEAVMNQTPVIISKQSGVKEVLKHCLQVDFWDIDQMANKMVAALKYGEMHSELQRNSYEEVSKLSWSKSAQGCIEVYSNVIGGMRTGW
ncbi:glycosyltransferase family 4 protein [Candidatus Woesearchaeota archaeon]|nr:glycosyltransferase family 4 protein [Candidatus Woesearchaeota archaeon]